MTTEKRGGYSGSAKVPPPPPKAPGASSNQPKPGSS
jgi:hypothetical protein